MEVKTINYSLDLPYPKINISYKNINYAKLLLQIYAGDISELSAITQYTYDQIILCEEYTDISKAFKKIAIAEMHHLDILGKMILALGADPRFWIKKKDKMLFWSSKFVKYNSSLREILKNAIEHEYEAIAAYKKIIDSVDDDNIKEILERIILDEELHIKIFSELYTFHCKA